MSNSLVEAFLVIERPRQRFGHWLQALAVLDSEKAPPLASVTFYYDPDADHALVGLRYDELALGPERLRFVVDVALLAEVGMIQPGELSEGDRKRFFTDRLAKCSVHVAGQRSVVEALSELVRQLKDKKSGLLGSLGREVPLPPDPPLRAKSTRDKIAKPVGNGTPESIPALGRAAREVNAPKLAKSTRDLRRDEDEPVRPPSKHVIARPTSIVDDKPRVPPPVPARTITSEPYMPTAAGPMPAGIIYARYLRSGRWVPLRIGALSLKGAALMSGALPRLHDHVDVALAFAGHRALVRGAVGKVSTETEAAMSGAATFSVEFELDDAARRQLTALLTAARAANVTIKPPPPRTARRFPVEWPICLGTSRGAVRADALDVSQDGMFVRPAVALTLQTTLTFSAVLDDGGSPISGRARVVRLVTAADARAAGLVAGFGLHVIDMSVAERERWVGFLTRIERRAEKRVLIGASPARLAELQATLAAAGYAVTGGTDPGALVQLASAESRPVDAALIDAGWLAPSTTDTWVETLFSARNVPCLTLHGDVRRARAEIDKLLSVV